MEQQPRQEPITTESSLTADPTADTYDPILLPPRRKGWPLIAWVVILALVSYLVYMNMHKPEATSTGGGGDESRMVTIESQGRYLVGAAHLAETVGKTNPAAAASMSKSQLLKAVEQMNRGSYSQRIRHAILVGEMSGPEEARLALGKLEEERSEGKIKARAISIEAVELLDRLYGGYEEAPDVPEIVLSESEQQKILDGLRWYGELALTPEGSDPEARQALLDRAMRTTITYLALVAVGLLVLVASFIIGIWIIALAVLGKLRPAIQTGSGHGGVYAETFALYLLFFFGMSLGVGKFLQFMEFNLGPFRYLVGLLFMFSSLIVLVWPVLRGISWTQVRQDIGLTFDGKPITNILLGPVTYLGALPLLGIGIILMVILARIFRVDLQSGEGPSHPIVRVAFERNWLVWVQVFLVAAVGAPIVEEIMFRGVFYRHLREASRWLRVWLSVFFSVVVSGFIFAVIHPQGWLGVPALMALATAFALAREWQGSLVPAIIAHGMNNGLMLLLLFLIAG